MKVWCPTAQSICENGFPATKDLKCCFWDEDLQVCLMIESTRSSFTISRIIKEKQLEALFKEELPSSKIPPSNTPPGMYLKSGEKRKISDEPSG